MAAIARTIGAAFCLDNHFSEAGSWPARPNAALQVFSTVVGRVFHRNTARPNAVLQVCGTVFLRNTARPNAALCKVRKYSVLVYSISQKYFWLYFGKQCT